MLPESRTKGSLLASPACEFPAQRENKSVVGPKPLLRLAGLSKRFEQSVAADNFTLDVLEGELVTLLGGSGAGKSTILKMVAGLVQPDSGQVVFDGDDVTDYPAHKLPFAMVFQSDALFPHMTVGKNLSFPLDRMSRLSQKEIISKVQEMCNLLGIDGLQSRKPGPLSGGEKRRVSLGRALLKAINIQPTKSAAVLLMDEPLSGLDKNLREAMQLEIKKLQQLLNLTIVYVTHDQVEAMSMSDRVGIIQRGALIQIGRPNEIYEDPANTYVAGFLGLSNVINGELQKDGMTITMPDGTRIQSQKSQHYPPGRVNVLIHPERIQFSTLEQTLLNSLTVTVVTSRFQGPSLVYHTQTQWGSDLFVMRPNSSDEIKPVFGSKVRVYWDISNTKLLPN